MFARVRTLTLGSLREQFRLESNGETVQGEIAAAAGTSWFVFHAVAGATYQIETDTMTLSDTIMDLLEPDKQTLIVENDDDERDANSYASYVEWTCPADGEYIIMVKGYGRATGTFSVAVTMSGGGAGGVAGGDPCNGGMMLNNPTGTIVFQPDGDYGDNAACVWSITCGNGQPPQVEFSEFATETDYDFVNLYDGAEVGNGSPGNGCTNCLGALSGEMSDIVSCNCVFASCSALVASDPARCCPGCAASRPRLW